MRVSTCALAFASLLALAAGPAVANDELIKLSKDPNQWVMPTGDYANHRYSALKQINKDNVKNLRPVWTFSTGVLRGHEGGAAGDRRRDVCAYAVPEQRLRARPQQERPDHLEVRAEAGSVRHPGDVLRHGQPRSSPMATARSSSIRPTRTVVALDAKTGKEVWSVENGDPKKGETMTSAPDDRQGQGHRRHQRRRVRRAGPRHRLQPQGRQDGVEGLFGRPGRPDPVRCQHDRRWASRSARIRRSPTWQGDQWKIGGGATWGWYSYDPQLNLIYYGSGNPSTWNPVQRPGDNKWSMTIFARNPDTGVAKWVYQMTPARRVGL